MKKIRLSNLDIREMRAAREKGYVTPSFNMDTGLQRGQQWKTWNRLQDAGLTTIEGTGEADGMSLTDKGKSRLATYESSQSKTHARA